MNAAEIAEACNALAQKVGPKAQVYFNITGDRISSALYTSGVCGDSRDVNAFTVHSDLRDPREGFADLEAKWLAERAKRNERIIEKMALEIIRLTDEFGQCTDAALRAEFGTQVAELSDIAVSRANQMAQRGPFEVVTLRAANAA